MPKTTYVMREGQLVEKPKPAPEFITVLPVSGNLAFLQDFMERKPTTLAQWRALYELHWMPEDLPVVAPNIFGRK